VLVREAYFFASNLATVMIISAFVNNEYSSQSVLCEFTFDIVNFSKALLVGSGKNTQSIVGLDWSGMSVN